MCARLVLKELVLNSKSHPWIIQKLEGSASKHRTMEKQLAKSGSNSVAVANSVVSLFKAGKVKEASTKLNTLKEGGTEVISQIAAAIKQQEDISDCLVEKVKELKRKIGKYGCEELELKKEKSQLEADAEILKIDLSTHRFNLESAERKRQEAEKKRQEAEEKEEKTVSEGKKIGGLVGMFLIPFGKPVGEAVGEGIGNLINLINQEEEKACQEVKKCKSHCSEVEGKIQSTEADVSRIDDKLKGISETISNLKEKQAKLHEDISGIKENIVFLKEALEFWNLFKHQSEMSVDCTDLMQKIVEKATKRPKLLSLSTTKNLANNFIKTWESEMEFASQRSAFVYSLEFNCKGCGRDYSEMPNVINKSFFCFSCYSHRALMH